MLRPDGTTAEILIILRYQSNMSEKPSFKKDSIVPTAIGHSMPRYLDSETKQARGAHKFDVDPLAGRTLQEYLYVFGLGIDELRGKKILDLGAGRNVLPAQELKDIAEVVSLSPDFVAEKHRVELEESVSRVAALGEQLPFGDDTFDMIWLFHVLDHLESYNRSQDSLTQQMKAIREAVRVVKPGGAVYIAPAHGIEYFNLNEAVKDLKVEVQREDTGFWANGTNYDINYDYVVEIDRIKIVKNPID